VKRFEYLKLYHNVRAENSRVTQAVLNEFGLMGWELVSVVSYSAPGRELYVLKRELP
jgi:hypothetical protein